MLISFSKEPLLRYRWWTFMLWNHPHDKGVKLGPVSICAYYIDEWFLTAAILNGRELFKLRCYR